MADQRLAIDVQVTGAQQGATQIKSVSGAVQGVGTATEETSKKSSALRNTLSGLATGFAVYKGAQFIKGAVTETTNLAKATAGLSRVTGMDTTTAAGWVGLAKERGIESTKLNMAFIKLSQQMQNVGKGSKPAIAAFQQLGIGTAGLQQMKPDQVLNAVSDAFAKMPNGAQKAVLAQQLFGRQAQALLPLINQGSGALNGQVQAMAKHTGITKDSIRQSMEMVKVQREWSATMVGVKVSIATALLPIMVALAKIIQPIASGFATLMSHSGAFRVAIISLTAALVTFIVISKAATIAGLAFDAAWGLIPALIIGIGVALVLLYQKVGWFRAAVNAMGQAAVAAFNWIRNAAINAFNWIKNNWPLLVSIIGGPIAAVAVQVITHWNSIRSAGVGAFNAVKSAADAAASIVGGAFKAAWNAVYGAIRGVVVVINQVVSAANKIASLPSKALGVLTGGVGGALSAINPFGQHGLYASHAGTAIVGERGPEMVHLPQGSRVSPFVQSYSGGRAQQVHTHVYLDGREIARAMGNYVAGQQAAR